MVRRVAAHRHGSRRRRLAVSICAALLVLGTAGFHAPGAEAASASGGRVQRDTSGPPTGTAPVAAPPRSYKPVFTGEAAVVQRAFLDLLAAYRRDDVDAVLARKIVQSRHDELAFMKNYSIRLFRITSIAVKGNTATVDYEDSIVARNLTTYVTTLLSQHDTWTKQNGRWKEQSEVASTPGIPRDLASATLTLRDDAPIAITTPLPRGNFAFVVENTGAIAKGLFILGIPTKLDVATFIPLVEQVGTERDSNLAAPFPHGVLEMGATPDVPANGAGTMVFNARLPSGRYLLLAREADHGSLLEKEYAVFTVK
jgi:hypothetical protein